MIAGLRGRLEAATADSVLVDVSGVIYRVGTSATTIAEIGQVGQAVRLLTHLFVREDQLTLYGFASAEELRLFETLISVTGVGPRLACAILSHVRADALYDAVAHENAALLATVPGVGKKTAARLLLELRGKLPAAAVGVGAGIAPSADENEVVEALRALGYTVAEAHGAAMRAGREPGQSMEERVLAALRELAEG